MWLVLCGANDHCLFLLTASLFHPIPWLFWHWLPHLCCCHSAQEQCALGAWSFPKAEGPRREEQSWGISVHPRCYCHIFMEVLVLRGPTLGPVKLESRVTEYMFWQIPVKSLGCADRHTRILCWSPSLELLLLTQQLLLPCGFVDAAVSSFFYCLVGLFLSHKGCSSAKLLRGVLEAG